MVYYNFNYYSICHKSAPIGHAYVSMPKYNKAEYYCDNCYNKSEQHAYTFAVLDRIINTEDIGPAFSRIAYKMKLGNLSNK